MAEISYFLIPEGAIGDWENNGRDGWYCSFCSMETPPSGSGSRCLYLISPMALVDNPLIKSGKGQ